MREEDWKTIMTLHEYQNLTRAANAMYMSQPTLTKQLHRIEHELGVPVVNRTNRGVMFTAEGEYLARQAAKISALIQDTKRNLLKMRGGSDGIIKLAVCTGMNVVWLLEKYKLSNDKIEFSLEEMSSYELTEAVKNEYVYLAAAQEPVFIEGMHNVRAAENCWILCRDDYTDYPLIKNFLEFSTAAD